MSFPPIGQPSTGVAWNRQVRVDSAVWWSKQVVPVVVEVHVNADVTAF